MSAGSTRPLTDLTIDEANLDQELSTQAAYYLMAAEKAIKAEAAYKEFKLQAEQLEATLSQKAREDIEKSGKKPTESMVQAVMTVMPDYQKAQKYLAKLAVDRDVMKALREAWYMRKDLLVQVAIKARCELDNMMNSTVKAAA